jgi:hypothetical protein
VFKRLGDIFSDDQFILILFQIIRRFLNEYNLEGYEGEGAGFDPGRERRPGRDFRLDGGHGGDFGIGPWVDYRMASGICKSNFFKYGQPALIHKKLSIESFFRDSRGNAIITGLYTALIIVVCFCVGIDAAGYGSLAWKLRNACTETLALIKIENGFDAEIRRSFEEFLTVQGVDPDQVTVAGTPKLVQRGDLVEIHAETTYSLKALRPLGHEMNAQVQVTLRGLAQDYIRR